MFGGLFVVSLFITASQMIKEATEPIIPAENWENKDLIYKDRMSGMSDKEFHRNLVNGKYKVVNKYGEPHRNERGQIIVENGTLYREDVNKYGCVQAQRWMRQGKYNL